MKFCAISDFVGLRMDFLQHTYECVVHALDPINMNYLWPYFNRYKIISQLLLKSISIRDDKFFFFR